MDEESDRNGQVSARKERTNIMLLPPNKKKKKSLALLTNTYLYDKLWLIKLPTW